MLILKSADVLRVLDITRPTLTKYVKTGIIKATTKPNGQYDYDEESVYAFLNKDVKRKNYIYARVSTSKQKKDLENQVEILKQFSFSQGIQISGVYQDIASGISFEKRKQFFNMLDEIVAGRAQRVIISYKDRLSRVGFDLFKYIFEKYNCEIVVVSEVGSPKLDSEEVFEELVSLLQCYSIQIYSKRKLQKIKEAFESQE